MERRWMLCPCWRAQIVVGSPLTMRVLPKITKTTSLFVLQFKRILLYSSLHLGWLQAHLHGRSCPRYPNVFSNIRTNPESNWRYHPEWRAPQSPVDKAHVIRFRSFRGGCQPRPLTFFVDENIPHARGFSCGESTRSATVLAFTFQETFTPLRTQTGILQRGRAWERHVDFDNQGPIESDSERRGAHSSISRLLPQNSSTAGDYTAPATSITRC